MSVGVVRHGQWARAAATGPGNLVLIVGSSTGRDGIHGATFASEEISAASEAKRPSVQVGDPFTEKLLLEATLEAIREGCVVGIQDMGAAGITCSTSEMSARGNVGMRIDLDRVPARESGMSAYELLLSESQERMLVVVEPSQEARIKEIFEKWDLHAEVIGVVTEGGILEITYGGTQVASVPAETLVLGGGAPVYIRETREPEYLRVTRAFDVSGVPVAADPGAVLRTLMATPNIASKHWVYEQYDSMVRTNNVLLADADAAVVLLKESRKALSMKTDCNGRYVYLNPRRGAMIAVAESARNVVCSGGAPVAITNCLNFGNPYKPEVYWQFSEAIRGMGEACRALDTPVTGGNVSFYNESPNASVYPTPVIGMLGVLDDVAHATPSGFRRPGDAVILLGASQGWLGGSEYLATVHGIVAGEPPPIDLEQEIALHRTVLECIRAGLVSSAHDCSDGGLAVALAECTLGVGGKPCGATVTIPLDGLREDGLFFGEDQSRVILSTAASVVEEVFSVAAKHGVPARRIGTTGGDVLDINGGRVSVGIDELGRLYREAIESRMAE
jgi:phosphoribosylformylglycinamidine synthase